MRPLERTISRRRALALFGAGALAASAAPATAAERDRWNSGVCAVSPPDVDSARGYGHMRGEPIKAYRSWLAGESNQRLAGYYLTEKKLDTASDIWLDYAIGGPEGHKGSAWSFAAGGGWDSVWTDQMQGIHQNWGSLRGMELSMAHELSGNWYDWSVLSEEAAFKAVWRDHYYPIVKRELKDKGRNVRVAICYALGQAQVASIYPGDDVVDVIAFDTYDQYLTGAGGHINNASDWQAFLNRGTSTSPTGLETMRRFALDHGKPISVPEWGLADTTDGRKDDNPYYIRCMHDWFAAHAPSDPDHPGPGEVLLECLYTDPGYDLDVYHDRSKNPASVAEIRRLSWG